MLKPSEQTPLTAARLAEIAAEHLPKGVLNVIFGHGEPAGAGLVRHPDVAMVSLTGDVATGKEVARAAADTLKRVHLELGGKAPVIVFDDADLEAVVEGVKVAGYFNAGQDCTAATRVLAGPEAPRRLRLRPRRGGRLAEDGRPRRRGHRAGPGRLGGAARARDRLPRARARRTRRR